MNEKFNDDQFLRRWKDRLLLVTAICGILSGALGLAIAATKVYTLPVENASILREHISKYEAIVDDQRFKVQKIETKMDQMLKNQEKIMNKLGL